MKIALTGTPGTGKTTVAALLKKTTRIIDLNSLIKDKKLYTGVDRKRKSLIADLTEIQIHINHITTSTEPVDSVIIIEGHLSHMLKGTDAVIVLRCHPRILKKRLEDRGYTGSKIDENAQAEALDIILCEAIDACDKVYETDTTSRTPEETLSAVEEIIRSIKLKERISPEYLPGTIDWIEEAIQR
ncbi:adenylate kinase [Methanosarcinales archaeon]|nr:MAG: adenylate kinase [Methanosarcinales archaeon]RLG26016.1 MAG: adenylate kinase [Methanosarcinales archaeon]